MFSKILIANRGEIAVRIAQTCREMDITSVAVYSTADRQALHVLRSDEAYCIGPPPPRESYLNIGAMLRAAKESEAEAVHPGYGFLAENAEFARAVQQAGLSWIGPPPEVIALMGDKVRAKALAQSAALPVVPGYAGESQDPHHMQQEAARIGYPVMLKAAAGGGGRGMRAVSSPAELSAALEGARREALGAFGDDRIFLEKLLTRPRHIEIQVVADNRGNAVALGERDCSLQRRHQKVVEESPSPALTPELRSAVSEAALRLVRAAGYVNAGTVEFLFDADQFYFLEMNTRIQVEHPVTEMVTGIDLIRLQIELAAGRPLGFGQLDIRLRGHALEARLYAEDPDTGFLPSAGQLQEFRPPSGAGVRNDVGVYEGAEVTRHYDPMLAKLVVHAETREEAISRLSRALADYGVEGPRTNRSFLQWIVQQPAFRRGQIVTDFLDREWKPQSTDVPSEVIVAAGVAEAMRVASRAPSTSAHEDLPFNPWLVEDGWRVAGAPRRFVFESGERFYDVAVQQELDGAWTVCFDGEETTLEVIRGSEGELVLRRGQDILRFIVLRQGQEVRVGSDAGAFQLRLGEGPQSSGRRASGRNEADLTAPMPGTVIKVAVRPGQRVEAHEPLVVLEAMKMEHIISAPHQGVVSNILFGEGDLVPAGATVVHLERT